MVVIDGVEMLEVREAASLVGKTPETVRRWVWSGRIHAVKRSNRLLLPRDEVWAAAGGGDRASARQPSLREWAAEAAKTSQHRRAVSASDLVLADRAERR
jgi:excisionase family DNA binding protein